MKMKVGIVLLLLVLVAFGLSFKADALNNSGVPGLNSWLMSLRNKPVIVCFNSDYPGSGRAAMAKMVDVMETGVTMILLDDLMESGTVLKWNDDVAFFPFSGIMSVRPCTEKEWRRLKSHLKE